MEGFVLRVEIREMWSLKRTFSEVMGSFRRNFAPEEITLKEKG